MDIINERKYSLISPFWLDVIMEAESCICDKLFGAIFSSQIMSVREARF